ncbi:type II toxin-antitoxin system VapC family toxin [Dyadobacter sp. 3J3]|uniref:type II toxin-antitoxin system VapC family toxin n=1 Tax=Dyadobacter sp. 3J3 TaxID=2606600 RepID=UPI00135B5E0A|nr:type II toxin-antitoxin system VapC family toxin [Dyadobacter sp. 3J3]
MAYLLDTHVVLWALDKNDKLSSKAETIISDLDSDCFVSVISFFEIAIKKNIGKIELNNKIPLFENHRDPFDRLILSTAFTEKLQVISADGKFQLYNKVVDTIWE